MAERSPSGLVLGDACATAALREACDDRYGLAATVLTPDWSHAQTAWRELPVGAVKVNDVFGGAPGGGGAAAPGER